MTEALMTRIKAQLVRHEGLRLKPYRCTAGKLTIGIGRNLDDRGISQKEAYAMLERDIFDCDQWDTLSFRAKEKNKRKPDKGYTI